ncbi:MAG TPA: hypothetical protein VJL29_12315 [Thermoguttaceae bacterium]|nr:hypothetical protein [Thermoguttaceae bacterium]
MSLAAFALRDPAPPLNPKTYYSPSSHFTFHVDPTDRQGRGPGEHVLRKDGREVWRRQLPFTLREARVFHDGAVAGYAYTLGPEGFGGKTRNDYGELLVVVLDPTGKVRNKHTFVRGYGKYTFEDQYPQPEVDEFVADPENNRFFVVLTDFDINRRDNEWRVYNVSTGKQTMSFHPKRWLDDAEYVRWCYPPRPLPGTPLILTQWHRIVWTPFLKGTQFALLDPSRGVVWRQTLPDDYTIPGDNTGEERLRNWMRRYSAILSVGKPGEFDLFFAKTGKRVSFAAKQDSKGKWIVKEIGRKPFQIPSEPAENETDETVSVARSFPEKPLPYLGAIRLGAAKEDRGRLTKEEIYDFTVDAEGRFIFVRRQTEKQCDLIQVDQQGRITNTISLPSLAREGEYWVRPTWLGGQRYLVALSRSGVKAKSEAFFADFAKKKLTPLKGFDCPKVVAVAGLSDGGFVVLARHRFEYTMSEELQAYDAQGRKQWTVGEDSRDPEKLFSPEDLCVTSDGLIAVVDNIRDKVTLYDRKGRFSRAIDLKTSFHRDPQYPADIIALPDGQFIVGDAVASGGPFVRMTREGKIVNEFRLHLANGQPLAPRLVAGPDGRLWTTYGAAFVELDNTGAPKHTIGRLPSADRIEEIEAANVDRQGNVYVLDGKTCCIHVHDPDGRRLFVCTPKPADAQFGLSAFSNISISDAGEIFAGGSHGLYLQYSPTGSPLGVTKSLGLDSVVEQWHHQPGTGRRWVMCYQFIALVDSNNRVLKRIERRPSNDWLLHPDELAVAPDGSLAIADSSLAIADSLLGGDGPAVSIYSPEGRPLAMCPSPTRYGPIAYNGRWLAAVGYEGPVFLWNASGKRILKFDPGKQLTLKGIRFLFFSTDGRELRILDGPTQTIHRFALPSTNPSEVSQPNAAPKEATS